MPTQPTHSTRSRARTRLPWILAAVVVVLALVAAGVVWTVQRDRAAQQEALTQWELDLDSWSDTAVATLPDPAVRLAPLVTGAASETADQLTALRAECDRAAAAGAAFAALVAPPTAPDGVRTSTPGYETAQARATGLADALTSVQTATADVTARSATFCATYPDLVQVGLDQSAGRGTFDGLLGDCALEDGGCVPLDTDSWAAIADAVGPAFSQPAQRRGELFAAGCPTAQLADACTLLGQQNAALVPLYDAYAAALRAGDRAALAAARDALSAELDSQRAALTTTLGPLLPGVDVSNPEAAFAAAISQGVTDTDTARLGAESAFLAVIG